MEFLEEILNGWRSFILKQTCSLKLQVCLSMYDLQSLTIFAKISTVDTWQGSEHTSETLVNLKYYEMRCILPESGVKNALNPKNSTKLKMTSSTAVVTSMLDCFWSYNFSFILAFDLVQASHQCHTPWAQDINWMYRGRSEDLLDIFQTSCLRSRSIICAGVNWFWSFDINFV